MSCKLQKCGHCSSLEEDDQCGMPEHRYCMFCELKEESDNCDTWASKLYEAIEAASKVLTDQQISSTTAISKAVEILKGAAKS